MRVARFPEKARAAKCSRDARKSAGRCSYGGCHDPVAPHSRAYCEKHLEANRKWVSAHYEKRREAGLCRYCDHPISERSRSRCDEHMQASRDYMRARREREETP